MNFESKSADSIKVRRFPSMNRMIKRSPTCENTNLSSMLLKTNESSEKKTVIESLLLGDTLKLTQEYEAYRYFSALLVSTCYL